MTFQNTLSAPPPPAAAGLPDALWEKLPPHPRLFADNARFAALRTQDDAVSRQLKALLRHDAEKKLTAAKITYPATGFLMDPARTVQGRILTLAMQYRLTGEKRYFDRAREELLQLSALPEWRPSHFLDVGEAALAAGIGLDWLYDDLSPDDREQIAQAIVRNALLPSLEVKEGATTATSWVNGDFNWNPVCHAGLVVGAIAIAEREPELARRIVNRAIKNLPNAGAAYGPDGSYPEGPSYWSYGTTFHVMLIEALRSAFGTSCDLEKPPGFLQTTDFMAQMVGPTGEDFNFSDYHTRAPSEPVLLWFARERNQPEPAREELGHLLQMHTSLAEGKAGQPGHEIRLSRHVALGLLWWNPKLPPLHSTSTLPLHWTAGGMLPLTVLRSAWNDPRATYVALKGGTPNHSHGHMDVGSFVLEANGVRWALDLGTENYNKMRAAKLDLWSYAQDSSRWATFRVGPEGHNLLRFDNALQNINGKATLRALPPENGVVGTVADISPLYRPQVERVERRVKLYPDRSVSLDDEWTTGDRAVDVSWQWLTHAAVTRIEHGLLLKQNGETLELKVRASGDTTIVIEDVSQPRHPQDSPNPGLSRIIIQLHTTAHTTATLHVTAIPGP